MTFAFAGQYGPQTISNSSGVPLATLAVNVYQVGTTTPVTLYASRIIGAPIANPVTTDANGNLTFFCAPGDVDIVGNAERLTVSVPADAADLATLPGTSFTGPVILQADPTIPLGAATKQYVDNSASTGAPLNSPAFTGIPTAPTASPLTDNTQVSTTAYTDLAVGVETTRAEAAEALLSGNAPLVIDAVVTATTANITAGHYTPCDTTANVVTLTLPTAPANGTRCGAELVTNGAHTVNIVTGGSDVFDVTGGGTSVSLTAGVVFESAVWEYKSTGAIWYTVANNLPLSILDTRYAFAVAPTFGTPTPSSGVAFTPTAFSQIFLGITCTTSTSINVTYGPSTGAEHTWIPTVTAPVGAFYGLLVPQNWKVVVTGTIADFTFVEQTVQ